MSMTLPITTTSFKKSCTMLSASWRSTIEACPKFKILGVAFKNDGRQDKELAVRSGKASTVMRALHYSVVLKQELPKTTKLSVFRSIFASILIYCNEPCLIKYVKKKQIFFIVSKKWFLHFWQLSRK